MKPSDTLVTFSLSINPGLALFNLPIRLFLALLLVPNLLTLLAAAPAPNFIIIDPEHPRTFRHQNGERFFPFQNENLFHVRFIRTIEGACDNPTAELLTRCKKAMSSAQSVDQRWNKHDQAYITFPTE